MIKIVKVFFCLLPFIDSIPAQNNQIYIRDISFKGNNNVSKNEVLLIVRQRPPNFFFRRPNFDARLLKLDALTLKNYYYSKGFLDVIVNESYSIEDIYLGNKYADIIYKINEGKQYNLAGVQINGNKLIAEKKINKLLGLKINEPYNPVGLNNNLYLLENEYQKLGKLFASITVQDEIMDSVKVNIDIDEGKYIYINNTKINGIGNIDSSIVYRELRYEKGDLYSKLNIDKTSKHLREIGIFSMANMFTERIIDNDSLVNVVIDLRRYKQREWNSSGGYDPISFAEGAPELPAYSVIIEWKNRAFFNTPKQFSTKIMAGIPVEVDFVAPRLRYDVSLSANWFLGMRFPTKVTGYYEKFIIYEQQKYQESINRFGANMSQQFRFRGRSYFEAKSLWENFADASEKNIQERSISLKLNIDKKDNPLFTRKGFLLTGLLKFAGFNGSREYTKVDLTLNSYIPITNNTINAIRMQIGKLWGWSNNYGDYSFEKFYLGGSTSMRGWEVLKFSENDQNEPQGETMRFMTNIEIRQKIYKSFGLTIFSDGGLLTNSYPDNFIDALKWDIGFGLTIDTPLGPVRIDYAMQVDDFNKKLINFGIQNIF